MRQRLEFLHRRQRQTRHFKAQNETRKLYVSISGNRFMSRRFLEEFIPLRCRMFPRSRRSSSVWPVQDAKRTEVPARFGCGASRAAQLSPVADGMAASA